MLYDTDITYNGEATLNLTNLVSDFIEKFR